MKDVVILIVGAGFFALGWWAIYSKLRRERALKEWPHAAASITMSRVANLGGDSTTYGLRVHYQYTVDGTLYHGSGDIAARKKGTRKDAEELALQDRVGAPLAVVYNPRRHAESQIVDNGRPPASGSQLIYPVGAMLIGLIVLLGLVFKGY